MYAVERFCKSIVKAILSSMGTLSELLSFRFRLSFVVLFLSGIFLCSAACPVLAANVERNAIVIWTKDGRSVSVMLEDSPKIEKNETDLILKSDEVELYYPLSESLKISFEKIEDDAKVESPLYQNRINVELSSGRIDISNLPPNETFSIYSIDGRIEICQKADSSGHVSIPLSKLPRGVHLLKSPHINVKILIK